MPSDVRSPSSLGMNIPDSVRFMPAGAAFKLVEEVVRRNPEEDEDVADDGDDPNPPGGGDLSPRKEPSCSSSSSSSSLSAKNILLDGLDGRNVSCDDDGDNAGLLYECFMAVSEGQSSSDSHLSFAGGKLLSMIFPALSELPVRFFMM